MKQMLKKLLFHPFLYGAFALAFTLDRFTKYLVKRDIDIYQSIEVIGNFFRFTHIRNDGIALGIFSGSAPFMRFVLLGLTLAAVVFVIYIYVKSKKTVLDQLAIGFILGGALGNMYDRIFNATVVDFLDFGIGAHRFYIFNLADSAIFLGIVLLSVQLMIEEKTKKEAIKNGEPPVEGA